MICVTHQADRLAEDTRESLENLHCRAEAAYQSPIAIAVFLECLLPPLEKLKNSFRRIRLFERGSKCILRKVYSGYFGVVSQGIDDQLDVGSGGCCLASRRHEDDGCFKFRRDSDGLPVKGREKRVRVGISRGRSTVQTAQGCGDAHEAVHDLASCGHYCMWACNGGLTRAYGPSMVGRCSVSSITISLSAPIRGVVILAPVLAPVTLFLASCPPCEQIRCS